MRLKDRVAIITGAAYGLGNAFARGYATEGARVVLADIDYGAAKEAEESLAKEGKEALAVEVDVSKVEDTLEMARRAVERFSKIDILVNNAALFGRVPISKNVPFNELSLEEWERAFAVNSTGPLLCCRAVFDSMKAQGKGKIINIVASQFYVGGGNVKYVHYVASKGALIGMTRALAQELGEYNICVNGIAPGSTLTEDPDDKAAVKIREKAIAGRCIKRIEYSEDLVGAAIFLASDESDMVTGQILGVNGGSVFI
jgi:3-oxoacyl-[acyl-carrier protein] reductase